MLHSMIEHPTKELPQWMPVSTFVTSQQYIISSICFVSVLQLSKSRLESQTISPPTADHSSRSSANVH